MSKKNKKQTHLHFFMIAFVILCVVFGGILVGRTQNKRIHIENTEQFIHSDRTRWSPQYIFGEEDREMFPVINKPIYVNAEKAAEFLSDNDIIYTFEHAGNMYAYPASILSFHHLVNDTVDGKPFVMTLCLLSGSAAAYVRSVDNQVLSFGVLGSLYNGNLIMFDDKTNSYWLQLTGDAIEGFSTNSKLSPFSSIETVTWQNIKDQKNLRVLSPVRDMEFYRGFYASFLKSPFGVESLGERKQNTTFDTFTTGIGIEIRDVSKFYPLKSIEEKMIINDEVHNWPILVVQDPILNTPRIFKRTVGKRVLTFTLNGEQLVDDQTHSQWNMKGEAISGELKGERLMRPVYTQVYWFSWAAFYPNTLIFR